MSDDELKQAIINLTYAINQQTKMFGAFAQKITSDMTKITTDVERCKLHLGKLVKFGPAEIKADTPSAPISNSGEFPSISQSSRSPIG